MSRRKRTKEAIERARATAAQLKPVAERIKPVASSTRVAAARQLRSTRAWAAPRVERTGQVLQDQVAPKVAGMLSTAAERLEPAKPPKRRWRVAVAAGLTAAASATAAVFGRSRLASGGSASQTASPASQNGQAAGGDASGKVTEAAKKS